MVQREPPSSKFEEVYGVSVISPIELVQYLE